MNPSHKSTPVVGIGASAGGLKALEQFFKNAPPDTGMAFVVILHRAKGKKSILSELIGKWTSMPAEPVKNRMKIKPNHIYTGPPEKIISISNNLLSTQEAKQQETQLHPIDVFFRSLAEDRKHRAACVILSGTGTDGTLGIKNINAGNGFVLAQSPKSAEYEGMPQSAINTGFVDHVLNPDEMPEILRNYFSGFLAKEEKFPSPPEDEADWLPQLFSILKEKNGHDFSLYKTNTIFRRLHRRMAVNQIEGYKEYLQLLRNSDEEIEAMFSELLIGVTSFFREPESFEVLKKEILPECSQLWEETDTFRAWIPGCSTGEEAYSLAMVLTEFFQEKGKNLKLNLFGTDVDSKAIDTARHGIYPQSIENDVSQERLRRFFSQKENFYKIKPNIRETLIFSRQDLLSDPPFSNTHIICCRNLLIYLKNTAQKKVIPIFYFALKDSGILMLGSSETIGKNDELFDTLNTKQKIFRKKKTSEKIIQDIQIPIGSHSGRSKRFGENIIPKNQRRDRDQFKPAVSRYLLSEITPPCMIVDANENITYIHGNMDKFMTHPSGIPSRKIGDLIRKNILFEVTTAFRRARKNQETVEKRNLYVEINGKEERYDLTIRPVQEQGELENQYSITFVRLYEFTREDDSPKPRESVEEYEKRIAELKNELKETQENYQAVMEEFETTNEEAKAANEELQSANEELQSTNEELESSKEELQSLNEELTTVNYELQSKVDELSEKEDDLQNLLLSSPAATVFLDEDLKIKRFTPSAGEIFNFISADVGRSFFDVSSKLSQDITEDELNKIQSDLTPLEREVKTIQDRWYQMRITPYKTRENVIQGVVINFTDITRQKEFQQEQQKLNQKLQAALDLSNGIVNSVPEAILILDSGLKVLSANRSFYDTFQASEKSTLDEHIFDLGNRQWDIPDLRKLLEEVIPKKQTIENYVVEHQFPKIGKKTMVLNARKLESESSDLERIVIVIQEKK